MYSLKVLFVVFKLKVTYEANYICGRSQATYIKCVLARMPTLISAIVFKMARQHGDLH